MLTLTRSLRAATSHRCYRDTNRPEIVCLGSCRKSFIAPYSAVGLCRTPDTPRRNCEYVSFASLDREGLYRCMRLWQV